jgi:hypothetical protein
MMGRTRIGGTQRGYKGHRNIRETTAWVGYIRASFVESRGGWSGDNGGETLYGPQPLLRHYESSNTSVRLGKRYYYCDSVLAGPFNMGRNGADWDGVEDIQSGTHFVIENCLLIVDPAHTDSYMLDWMAGGQAIRNCQFLCLDTPRMNSTDDPELAGTNMSKFEIKSNTLGIGTFDRFVGFAHAERNFGFEAEVLHNTFVLLRDDTDAPLGHVDLDTVVDYETTFGSAEFDNVTPFDSGPLEAGDLYTLVDGHNVGYAPNLTSTVGPAMTAIDLPAGVRVLDVWMKMIWERQTFTLSSAVSSGNETPVIAYPNDWNNNPTTGADYTGTAGNNGVRIGSTDYGQLSSGDSLISADVPDALTINHDLDSDGNPASPAGTGTHFTITNRSGASWSGDIVIILDRGSTAMEPDLLHEVDQTEVKLYRPTTAQALTGGVRSTLFDFQRQLRPNAGFAISPTSGTNAAGAILPA